MEKRTGWIVSNGFLSAQDKFRQLNQRIINAAEIRGVELKLITNDNLLVRADQYGVIFEMQTRPDFVLFMDKDIRLAQAMEAEGLRLFNSASAIGICDDKSLTALMVAGHGIETPQTIIGPQTFDGVGYSNLDFLSRIVKQLGFPLVVKECFGSFGQQVWLMKNAVDLAKLVRETSKQLIFQEFISNSYGRDVRLNVVDGEVVAAMLRTNECDFRANITNGASMKAYHPSKAECDMAIKVCGIVGAEFAGVDLLFGENGPVFCEANSNSHIENIYQCTGIDVSEKIIDYIIKTIS